jgi:DNA polymerase I-like protein with 3'-5' exonuclease and polymerase domains
MITSTLRPSKLNKAQLAEFAKSAISTDYALANFYNIPKSKAPTLLDVSSPQEIALKGSALNGGWVDSYFSQYKPKNPRISQGTVVKYESLGKTTLSEVNHPECVTIDKSAPIYFVEGHKKAVAVAQATKARVFSFSGLSVGIHLADQMNAFLGQKRLILDNDSKISAVKCARSLGSKLSPDFEIGIFSGFKGIDDALASGVDFSEIHFISLDDWSASIAGYVDAHNYTFSSPQFHDVEIPESSRFTILQAGKGTGKTWYMANLAKNRLKTQNVFVLTHRINLSRANAKKLNISYIDDENYRENGGSVGLCIDSLLKIQLDDCIKATIFLDEFTQVLDHLMNSDTLKNKRSAIFKRFGEILMRVRETGGMIVVADADADAKSVELISELGGFKKEDTFLIRNTFVFQKGIARHSLGISIQTKSGVSSRKRPIDIVAKILKESLAGKRLFCCLSAQQVLSKYSTQCLEQFLITNGVDSSDILRIDSETIGDNTHPAYKAAERINELCAKYPIILASPSLNTGVDIQYKGFDCAIGIFSGTLDSNGVRQFLSRVRDWVCERIFYAPNQQQSFGDNPITNKSDFDQFKAAQEQSIKLFDEEWYAEINDNPKEKIIPATTDYFLNQAFEKKREKYEYAKRIKQGLIAEGFTLEPFQPEITTQEATEIYGQLEQIQNDLDTARKLLVQEKEVDEETAKKLYESQVTSVEDKAGLKGYEIRRQLNLAPTPEVQKALEQGIRAKLENNFAATEGYEISQQLWQKEQYWKGDRGDTQESASDFVKRNLRPARIKALHKVNFFNFIQEPFNSADANRLFAELRKDALNLKLFPELPKKESKQAIKAIKALAERFNFDVVEACQDENGKRSYIGLDLGFDLSDGFEGITDVKPKIFEFWTEKRKKQAEDWLAFKLDFTKVKLGQRLDNSKNLPKLSEDFKYAKLSTRARTLPLPSQPDYLMVCSANASEFKLWLASRLEIAVDIESYGECSKGGLNHIYGSIRLIQFATTDAIWIVERGNFELVRNEIKALLENPNQRKIGHNFMFDLRFLRKEFATLACNCADTMLGSRCLMGDMGAAHITSHSLQQASENFLGIEVDKTEQKSDWGGELTSEQIAYAAKDPWLTFVLYKRLEELTKDPSLLLLPLPKMIAYEAWEVENRFLFAAQQMEDTGYEIDIALLVKTKEQYQSVRDELMSKWDAPHLPTQKGKLQQFINEKYGLSLKSLGKATAAENSNIPEIKLMQQICACNAILHTLSSIETQIEIHNGRVKPYFKVLSGTGRTSSGATKIEKCLINLQSLAARVNPVLKEFNLPALKALFRTDLIIDLPASHGRISAELGNDQNALAAYMDESIDLHCQTASAVANAVFPETIYSNDWIQANKKSDPIAKGLRDTSKNTYYGWLNGAGVSTIQRQIKSNLQIKADKSACQKALEGLQSVFSGTTDYAKQKLKELEKNQFIVNGIVCGWMEFAGTYLCWKLGAVGGDLNVPATKAFAGIWSRTESLLMKLACYRIAEKFDAMPDWNSRLQNFIHDEINCEIGCDEAASFAHSVVKEEFGKICSRTVVGFDQLEKCYPLNNWSDK